jgi:hypothetical protein
VIRRTLQFAVLTLLVVALYAAAGGYLVRSFCP